MALPASYQPLGRRIDKDKLHETMAHPIDSAKPWSRGDLTERVV